MIDCLIDWRIEWFFNRDSIGLLIDGLLWFPSKWSIKVWLTRISLCDRNSCRFGRGAEGFGVYGWKFQCHILSSRFPGQLSSGHRRSHRRTHALQHHASLQSQRPKGPPGAVRIRARRPGGVPAHPLRSGRKGLRNQAERDETERLQDRTGLLSVGAATRRKSAPLCRQPSWRWTRMDRRMMPRNVFSAFCLYVVD